MCSLSLCDRTNTEADLTTTTNSRDENYFRIQTVTLKSRPLQQRPCQKQRAVRLFQRASYRLDYRKIDLIQQRWALSDSLFNETGHLNLNSNLKIEMQPLLIFSIEKPQIKTIPTRLTKVLGMAGQIIPYHYIVERLKIRGWQLVNTGFWKIHYENPVIKYVTLYCCNCF